MSQYPKEKFALSLFWKKSLFLFPCLKESMIKYKLNVIKCNHIRFTYNLFSGKIRSSPSVFDEISARLF